MTTTAPDELAQFDAEISAGIQRCIAELPDLEAQIQQLIDAVPPLDLEAM